jgi:hypothetical protein
MSYSRRQLYALGEPLGESATCRKADGGLILGGGGSAPSQQTVSSSELPSWAIPYEQNLLQQGQAQTAKGYQAYVQTGANGQPILDSSGNTIPISRIAGFSPLQLQAQQQAAGMQTAPQLDTASQLAQSAGLNAQNIGQNYDPMGAYSQNWSGRQAGQYMNPFVQASLNPQIAMMQQQQGQQANQMAGQATQAGAFGGSRFGLAQAQQNLNNQIAQQNLVGNAYNTAYNNAQQQFNADQARQLQAQGMNIGQQQFGANLGMQGAGMGLNAANALTNIGQNQYTQNMGINALQNQYGGQQQALQQQGLTQSYQDFLNQQNFPYQQMSYMSNMIRGLPLGTTQNSQVYQGTGAMLGSLAGLGIGGAGLANAYNTATGSKEGGEIKSYASGGNVASIVHTLSDQQLQQAKQEAQARGDGEELQAILAEESMRASERGGMAGAYNQIPYSQQVNAANGGIIALAVGGEPTQEEIEAAKKPANIYAKAWRSKEANEASKKPGRSFSDFLLPKEYAIEKPLPDVPYDPATATRRAAYEDPTATASKVNTGQAQPVLPASIRAAVPDTSFEDVYQKHLDQTSKLNEEDKKLYADMVKKHTDRIDEMHARGLNDALTKYGFMLASAASKPGATFFKAAGEAAPAITESLDQNQRLINAEQDNLEKMQMDQARFNSSIKRSDMQAALGHAQALSQDKKAQQQIELQKEALRIQAVQAARPTSPLQYAYETLKNNPNAASLLERAGEISGNAFRADAAMKAKLADERLKIAMLPESPTKARMIKAIDDELSTLGGGQFSGFKMLSSQPGAK